jgi:hypothetical protein
VEHNTYVLIYFSFVKMLSTVKRDEASTESEVRFGKMRGITLSPGHAVLLGDNFCQKKKKHLIMGTFKVSNTFPLSKNYGAILEKRLSTGSAPYPRG